MSIDLHNLTKWVGNDKFGVWEYGQYRSTYLVIRRLDNGKYIPICDVNVNDILENNTKVLGVVKIDGRDITQYNHIFGNTEVGLIGGSKNIHINDPFLGIINCIQEKHTIISEKLRFPVLYHLLTDKKFYNVNGIQVNDYNYGIDAYTS